VEDREKKPDGALVSEVHCPELLKNVGYYKKVTRF